MADPEFQTRSDPEAGFSLLELLVGISILAVLLVLVSGGVGVVSRAAEKGQQSLSSQEEVYRGFAQVRADLEAVQRHIWRDGGKEIFAFAGSARKLEFITIAPPHPTRPGPVFLQYLVEKNGRSHRLVRRQARFSDQITEFPQVRFTAPVDIINRKTAIRFSYGERTETGVRWSDNWNRRDRIPDLIKLIAPQTQATFGLPGTLVVRPKIVAEAACVTKSAEGCTIETDGSLKPQKSKQSDPDEKADE